MTPPYDKESNIGAAEACDCDMNSKEPLLSSTADNKTTAASSYYGSLAETSDNDDVDGAILHSMGEGDSDDGYSDGGIGGSIHHSIRQLSRRVQDLVSQHTGMCT